MPKFGCRSVAECFRRLPFPPPRLQFSMRLSTNAAYPCVFFGLQFKAALTSTTRSQVSAWRTLEPFALPRRRGGPGVRWPWPCPVTHAALIGGSRLYQDDQEHRFPCRELSSLRILPLGSLPPHFGLLVCTPPTQRETWHSHNRGDQIRYLFIPT